MNVEAAGSRHDSNQNTVLSSIPACEWCFAAGKGNVLHADPNPSNRGLNYLRMTNVVLPLAVKDVMLSRWCLLYLILPVVRRARSLPPATAVIMEDKDKKTSKNTRIDIQVFWWEFMIFSSPWRIWLEASRCDEPRWCYFVQDGWNSPAPAPRRVAFPVAQYLVHSAYAKTKRSKQAWLSRGREMLAGILEVYDTS